MGKKVTYGITYSRASKLSTTLQEHYTKFETLKKDGHIGKAAETIIDITEYLLDVYEEAEDPHDPEILNQFPQAIEYAKEAAELLETSDVKELLPRYFSSKQSPVKIDELTCFIQGTQQSLSILSQVS